MANTGSIQTPNQLYKDVPLGLFHVDACSRVVEINEWMASLASILIDQAIGQRIGELFPCFAAQIEDSICRVIESGNPRCGELIETGISADSDVKRILKLSYVPVHSEQAVVGVSCVVEDVTSDGLDEASVERTVQSLRESEDRFRQIADATTDVFWLVDVEDFENRKVIYVNKAFEELWQMNAKEVYLNPTSCTKCIHPDDQKRISVAFRNFCLGKSEFDHEYRIVRADKSIRHIWSKGKTIADETGRIVRVAGIAHDITEQKKVQEKLRESEEKYQRLIEELNGIVFQCDAQTLQFSYISPHAEEILGFPVERWLSEPEFWVNHLHDDDRDTAVNFCCDQTKAGKDHSFEYRMIGADGGVVWFHDSVRLIRDASGEVTQLHGIMLDITAQKNAEAERAERLRHLQIVDRANRITESATDVEEMLNSLLSEMLAALRVDRAWLLYPCDPGAEALTILQERTVPEYPGALSGDKEIPVDSGSARIMQMTLDADRCIEFHSEFLRKATPESAEAFQIKSLLCTAIRPKLGKPWAFGLHQCSFERQWTDADKAIFDDIGHRIEDALSRMLIQRELRESEERFSQIADATTDVFWLVDVEDAENYRILYVNRAFENLWQMSADEFYRKPTSWLDSIHPDDQDRVSEAFRDFCLGRGEYNLEYRIIRSNNDVRHIWVKGETISDGSGKIVRVAGIAHDITQRIVDEGQIKRQAAELAQVSRLSTLGELTAGMAHELNQPLTAIANYSEILHLRSLNGSLEEKFLRQTLLELKNTAFRTSDMIKRLRSLVHRAARHRSTVAINDVVNEMLKFVRLQLEREGVELKVELAENLPEVNIDAIQIQQVMLNLIKNAQQAMTNSKDSPRVISVQTRDLEDFIQISVADTGHGLKCEDTEQLFEQFFSTTEGGLGIGLQICRSIVEFHQGRISAENNAEGGATFWFTIPRDTGKQQPLLLDFPNTPPMPISA